MRKLNGITINGEFLGNGVVINGMFRAICAISPVIMREFVTIINKIEVLDDAVRISNFNCDNDENRMDIEFQNKKSKGIASLYFDLYEGEPELIDCKLVLDDNEFSTIEEKKAVTSDSGKVSLDEKLQKLKKLQELKEARKGQQKNRLNDKLHTPIPNKTTTQPTTKEQKLKELLEKKRRLQEGNSPVGSDTGGSVSRMPDGSVAENASLSTNSDGSPRSGTSPSGGSSSPMAEGDYGYSSGNDSASSIQDLLADLSDEDLENMSLEELEQLEAQMAELNDSDYDDSPQYDNGYPQSQYDFAEKLTQGIAEGLSQGLAQGLSQGLAQGLQGFSPRYGPPQGDYGNPNFAGAGAGYPNNNPPQNFNFGDSSATDFGNDGFNAANAYPPNPADINKQNDESMLAQSLYDFDANANMDDLSNLYSNFYDMSVENAISYDGSGPGYSDEEYPGVQSQANAVNSLPPPEQKMTLDEYMMRQKAIAEAKEKMRRKKIKIVGSKGRVSAKALEDGIFVSGSQIYKWGDVRHLEE